MRTLLSPVVTDIFTENFKTMTLKPCPSKPNVWSRYINDISIIQQSSGESLTSFKHLNDHYTAMFNSQKEVENDSLPSLETSH